MHAVALAARERTDLLLLVRALEVEIGAIGARIHLALAEQDEILAARDLLPYVLLAVERVAGLIDIAEMHGLADLDRALVRLLLPDDHAEQRGLARYVRTNHADDAARWQLEGEVVDQQVVAERLGETLEIDHVLTEPLGHRDDDLRGLGGLLRSLLHQLLVALIAGLGLRLPRARGGRDPFLLARERALARFFLAALLREPLLLLRKPGRIVALIGNTAAAIELEDPAGDVVEEVAVVGDDQDGAGIIAQVAFEPIDGFGIEMVRGLVEQQQLGLLEQQPAERDSAALAARQLLHVAVVRRTAQRVHRLVDLGVEIPKPLGLDLVLQLGHLVGVLVRVVHGEFVVAIEDRLLRRHSLHHVLAHALARIELWLLLQIPYARALGHPALAGELLVDAGHDAKQRRFAGAVDAEHADLGVGIERQVDILQDLAVARIGLGEAFHVIDELTGHRRPARIVGRLGAGCREVAADVARPARQGKAGAHQSPAAQFASAARRTTYLDR